MGRYSNRSTGDKPRYYDPRDSQCSLSVSEEEEAPPYVPNTPYNNKELLKEKLTELSSGFTYVGARPANVAGRPKNIIFFGETGVGKSSVINLLAGAEVAKTSSGLEGCTMYATEYSFSVPGFPPLHIFDTVGLEEPEIGVNTFLGAIARAHQLIDSLRATGGVDLLVFCIRGGRITAAVQRNYRLFFNVLCGGVVPLAIIVTHLEQEDVMEDWWDKNVASFERYKICPVAHACITALPARLQAYAQKRAVSQQALRNMLLHALGNTAPTHVRDKQSWLAAIITQLRSLLIGNVRYLKKKDLLKKFETDCKLPRGDAEVLAQMLTKRVN